MSRFSRPRRTKLYDCNYNMSERYYKPMVDHLDRKYTPGRPTDEIPRHFSPLAESRRREQSPEEARRRPLSTLLDEMDAPMSRANGHREDSLGMNDEMVASMKRIAASKAARAAIEDEINEMNTLRSRRKEENLGYGEKMLDAVGLSSRAMEDDASAGGYSMKRRTLKMTSSTTADEEGGGGALTKWSALKGATAEIDDTGSTAKMRARMSKNRLVDLDAEMEELESRAAARERRNNHLRAVLQESRDVNEDVSSVRVSKTTVSQKAEKKTVTF